MNSSRTPQVLLILGATLLLGSPIVAMIPEFRPPDGCPPCMGFPSITHPFVPVGASVGAIGLILAILGYVRLHRIEAKTVRVFWPLICIAFILVLAGLLAMSFVVRGSGWVIALYSMEGAYLFALGIAIGLFAIFDIWTNWINAITLSASVIVASFSLLLLYTTYTDFLPSAWLR